MFLSAFSFSCSAVLDFPAADLDELLVELLAVFPMPNSAFSSTFTVLVFPADFIEGVRRFSAFSFISLKLLFFPADFDEVEPCSFFALETGASFPSLDVFFAGGFVFFVDFEDAGC